jgi:hypothetical protein
MQELGHELLLGDPSAIHASNRRKQKTDKRDARRLLTLLAEDRFPVVWQPSVENEDTRQLPLHRCRLVRFRARVKNQLDSMAKNEGLLSKRVWCAMRRQQIEALPLSGWYVERRKDLLFLLEEAASKAQRYDASWRRQYVRLSMNKHHGVAKAAIAHKLAVRLYWMLRSGQDYQQVMERGSHAEQSV